MNGHSHISCLAACLPAVLLCLLPVSCAENDFSSGADIPGAAGDHIRFGISSGVGTRSADGGCEAGDFVLRSADSADTLYVRATVTDGIGSPSSRAAKVTAENFYDTFHVLAYRTINGTLQSSFFMDEDVTKKESDVWSSDADYYWPGNDNEQLQFLAWAPSEAFSKPANSGSKLLADYEVPKEVANQKDVVIAMTGPIGGAEGNTGTAVPLTFKHICTAVRFVVGKEMQIGTIKSVTLHGVKSKGSYDMASGEWRLGNEVSDFPQNVGKDVFGTIGEGTPVTTEDQTFMMLPQKFEELPAGAALEDGAWLEVVFSDEDKKERIFVASLAGAEWQKGSTVTYSISISPEYEFNLTENPELDAHYEILKTTLQVTGVPAGTTWTITAPTLGAEDVSITPQSELNQYAMNGYWTDRYKDGQTDKGSARGEKTFERTGSGDFPIAIFVPENSGDTERSIDLTVSIDGTAYTTISLTQYAPSWNGSTGCERIEEEQSPWGMYWSEDYKIIYDLTKCADEDRESFHNYLAWTKTLKSLSENLFFGWLIKLILGDNIPDLSFVEEETSEIEASSWWGSKTTITDKVTINLGDLGTTGIALSPTDGAANTLEIYNYKGFSVVIDLINRLENIPGHTVSTTGEGISPAITASLECMKLNSCDIVTVSNEQLIQFDAVKWYLPAREEAPQMQDSEHTLNGTYWTSTAVDDNQNAYIWNAGQTSANEMRLRKENHNVRAVRKKE